MKKLGILFLAITTFISCNKKTENQDSTNVPQEKFQVFGDSITAEGALTSEELLAKYLTLKTTDTLQLKFTSEIISTCKKKGCWMTVKLPNEQEVFVKFKDYAFFVPKEGAENHKTILSGKAFVTETSVDELKHYAKDANKSDEEINQITEPKIEYGFMANGVLIAE